MTGCGRPKTTGRSHNKRSNTYCSTRAESVYVKKAKPSSSNRMTNYFKPLNQRSQSSSGVEQIYDTIQDAECITEQDDVSTQGSETNTNQNIFDEETNVHERSDEQEDIGSEDVSEEEDSSDE